MAIIACIPSGREQQWPFVAGDPGDHSTLGLSMRATSSLLGTSRVTVTSYVRANGVPGRRNDAAASSNGSRGD